MLNKRQQLTLFVEESTAEAIESIRQQYNPVQYNLIKCHVTLCREDEIERLERVVLNLENLPATACAINFGSPVRFSDGKGVLIPAIGPNEPFHLLRKAVLEGIVERPRMHEPHITLMHPRNATCTDEIFEKIEKQAFPSAIVFKKISLIEQENGGEWKVLREFLG